MRYERDMMGHGKEGIRITWPNEAKIAVQFVINYEEGGENCLLHGDEASEAFLSEIVGISPWPGQRHWNMESIYEYGARSGYWRLHSAFTKANIPVTVYGVATALARSPEQVASMKEADWEIACHGLKWIEYKDFPIEEERAHMEEAIALHERVIGNRPLGWYTGRCSMNTIRLATEEGGFEYVSDSYADDLPYWITIDGKNQLIVPYTLDANDMRFATYQGFNTGMDFFTYLKDSFDVLYREGMDGFPKMMSIGLHCRLIGRPGRMSGLLRFMEYIDGKDKVWTPTRLEIARHWTRHYPPQLSLKPASLPKKDFIKIFGGIIEHSPWVAEKAYNLELGPAHDCPEGIHSAFCQVLRASSEEEKLIILNKHPELAGKAAKSGKLGSSSKSEQHSRGLDQLKEKEGQKLDDLNGQYLKKFGFPYIIAVKDYDKRTIFLEIEKRINRSREVEFREACHQVERIAWYRIKEIFDRGD